jgi:flagellar hook protein FlgE
MYSGISGMKGFQSKLDVIGNNIANVNTFGFKKGRVTFKDMMSQTVAIASGASASAGGVNAKQVGLGTTISSIDTIHTQGNTQTTGRPLDLAISGDGYFVVGTLNSTAAPKPTLATDPADYDFDGDINKSYTRAGNFYLDNEGYLVNSEGLYLVGHTFSGSPQTVATNNTGLIRIPSSAKSYGINDKGVVQYVDSSGVLQEAGQILLAKFANNEGLQKVGSNLYQESTNSGPIVPTAGGLTLGFNITAPGSNGSGAIVSGSLEMSNVDLSEEFTEMIVAQRGFQANTRIITTSDEILQELVNLKR